MLLALLTRILLWAGVGYLLWYVLLKFIPRKFLTWFGGAIVLALIVLSFVDPNDQTIGAIWNFISLPLSPLGATVMLLVFALIDGMKKVKGEQVAIALAILLLSSVPLVARGLVGQAERSIRDAYNTQRGICEDVCPVDIPESAPLGRVVAVVMLGENMDLANNPRELPTQIDADSGLNPTLTARLGSTANLYRRLRQNGADPFVLLTAGPVRGTAEERANKEEILRQILTSNGVPAGAIGPIGSTGMDVNRAILATEQFLGDRQLLTPADRPRRDANRVAIVAPAITMRRTALAFEQRGLDAVAWPTDLYSSSSIQRDSALAGLSDLVPSVEALRLTSRYWDELMSTAYYFLRGWLPGFDVGWSEVVEIFP